jgi:hypothetical protein
LLSRLAVPAAFSFRDFVEIGGLMSYGANMLAGWLKAQAQQERQPATGEAGRSMG